jgi:hypothetical protein
MEQLPPYPQWKLLRLDAQFAFAAWMVGLAFMALALLHAFQLATPFGNAILFGLPAFLALGLAHFALSICHKCPKCRRSPTFELFRVHRNSNDNSPRLRGWGGVVLAAVARRPFACIHCGARFLSSPTSAGQDGDV